ncbi:30S ribosomal protein S16 [Candidatus Hodgkinia cicadicola]|uniref:30S ribosomal protein S16 n=1 Tax=Candidatus Hodgkinia cicadicola TaxID=573658 RepID=A0ABX4MJV3_9HYPH|nr:30S ribosomal protein S16 [Candidatus Hodgkinia cicadicola]
MHYVKLEVVRINLLRKNHCCWQFVVVRSKGSRKVMERIGFLGSINDRFRLCLNIVSLKSWMLKGALLSCKAIKLLMAFGVL